MKKIVYMHMQSVCSTVIKVAKHWTKFTGTRRGLGRPIRGNCGRGRLVALRVGAMCPKPRELATSASHTTMTHDSRHGSLWKGLACLLTLSQLPLVSAQVAEVEKATNASLLWGPYRPNLYFGVRPRIPKSLMGGLMWTRVEDYQSVQNSKSSRAFTLQTCRTRSC